MSTLYTPNARIEPPWLAEALSIWRSSDFHDAAWRGLASVCPMFKKLGHSGPHADDDLPYTSLEIAATAQSMAKMQLTHPDFHRVIHNAMRRDFSNVNIAILSIASTTLTKMIDFDLENGLESLH